MRDGTRFVIQKLAGLCASLRIKALNFDERR